MKKLLKHNWKHNILLILLAFSCGFSPAKKKPVTIYIIGDSTVANYADNYDPGKDYYKTRYPVAGWGQVFQECFTGADLTQFKNVFKGDSVIVADRARGGRSTRTFFQEGRWRAINETLQEGDVVIMQFGHNDGAENYPERYVPLEGYKEFLRLFVTQTREKGAVPIILTPVCRNYPWNNGHLENVHGQYPQAAMDVAKEMNVFCIDLNQLCMDKFSELGQDFVTQNYFMNFPAGKYEAYPDGQADNTHFQTEGARFVAKIVFDEMKKLGK
jgi:lysophospholipase L1-like esterase